MKRAVDALLKDGLRFVELELGLEVPEVVGVAAAVGAATGIGEVEGLVDNLLKGTTPERTRLAGIDGGALDRAAWTRMVGMSER